MMVHSQELAEELSKLAQQLRLDALEMIHRAQSGHPGGSLSCAEIIAVMYGHQLRVDPKRPDWRDRDRFVVSKGHAAPVYYAALARSGFFPIDWLKTFRALGGRLQGHPDRNRLPGVDMSSGPLGNGFSVAVGLAMSARSRGASFRTYALIGDGEIQGGVVWEAALAASKYRLDNLVAILDYNGVQLDGPVCEVMPLEPLNDKWTSFGWHVMEANGHDVQELLHALDGAHNIHGRPTIIVAHTIKGKGVSFMEDTCHWHGRAPCEEEYRQALAELREGGQS